MRTSYPYLLLAMFFLFSPWAHAEKGTDTSLYVYLKGGKVEAYPSNVLKAKEQNESQLILTLNNDSLITYSLSEVDSLGAAPNDFPVFTSFKFNNKYNDNVYTDVFATIGENTVTAKVGAIGKRLTPSFKLSSDDALVYVGDTLQQSKVSRRRFANPVVYTVTRPGYKELHFTKIKDEEWSEGSAGEVIYEKIPLTVDMLSTNHPGNAYEGLDKMLDGDTNTFFHSTYGDQETAPYVTVHLNEPLNAFVLEYVTRPDASDYCPLEMWIECSHDGLNWIQVRRLDASDGIPTSGFAEKYTSPNIELYDNYEYLRFTVPAVEHKNRKYFVLAEFALQKYIGTTDPVEPELISPAQYAYTWKPFGRDYEVRVDWLTDADTASVPRIDINLLNGKKLSQINKSYYFDAEITIDGGNVFPDMLTDTVQIKGRGNSTWHGAYGKNPYRLKFPEAVKPFGLTKGKNWVLLANSMTGSMLTNAIGMKIARMVGTAGANDIIPVELYINGEYRGNYNLTQHVGLHNNSIDIDETNATLLELDTNGGDDDPTFYNVSYGITTKVKEPDFKELPIGSVLTLNKVKEDFNRFSLDLSVGVSDLEKRFDVNTIARYLLVNELIQNEELMHPKSCFLYREDLTAMHSKYVFGPVWDLDWAYGYEHAYRHCPTEYTFDYFTGIQSRGEPGGYFYADLRKRESVSRAYYKLWTEFIDLHLDELADFIEDYYAYARPSLEHNALEWNDGANYGETAQTFKKWLTRRARHIYSTLEVYDLDEKLPIEVGDVNQDGAITLADVVCINNHLLGLENESFDADQADANKSGDITITDAVWVIALAMQEQSDYARHLMLPQAEAVAQPCDFTATLGSVSEMPVKVRIAAGNYAATQFDVILPEGMTLEEVTLPENWKQYEVEYAEKEDAGYRIVVYAQNGATFPVGEAQLSLWVRPEQNIQAAQRVVSLDGVTLVNAQGEDERMSAKSAKFDMDITGIDEAAGSEAVNGGEALNVEALIDGEVKVYTVDGRLVKVCPVVAGTNRILLPAGVYIVNQKKVIINR